MDSEKENKNKHAAAMSALGASKGGLARAAKLGPAMRSLIARKAAAKRWDLRDLPRALRTGPLKIGGIEIDCAVLDDAKNTRVISETRFMAAMGMYRSGALSTRRERDEAGARMPLFLAYKNLKPFIEKHLGGVHLDLLKYITPEGGVSNVGIPAETLPKVCEVWLDAERAGVLGPSQKLIAAKADILLRGFAQVGIIALIDEATGFQDQRATDALAQILEAFIVKELKPYVKTFPMDYYREIYRLNGWEFPPKKNRHNSNLGKMTNDQVYARLAPGVKDELQRLTPRAESGRLKHKMFQHLTDDVGSPKLREHFAALIMAMKLNRTWKDFKTAINTVLPRYDLPRTPKIWDVGD